MMALNRSQVEWESSFKRRELRSEHRPKGKRQDMEAKSNKGLKWIPHMFWESLVPQGFIFRSHFWAEQTNYGKPQGILENKERRSCFYIGKGGHWEGFYSFSVAEYGSFSLARMLLGKNKFFPLLGYVKQAPSCWGMQGMLLKENGSAWQFPLQD